MDLPTVDQSLAAHPALVGAPIPALDGIRALAVLATFAYHLYWSVFSYGWIGVELFFCISGFLITGILLRSRTRPHQLRNYYARRALRIFPVYFLALGLVVLEACWRGRDIADLGPYLYYFQNHLLAATNWHPRFPLCFNHTWTLAIEEQFYLVWPLAVLFLDLNGLALLGLGAYAASTLARLGFVLLSPHPLQPIDTGLLFNVDCLAAGALLALAVFQGQPAARLRAFSIGGFLVSSLVFIACMFRLGPWNDTMFLSPAGFCLRTALSLGCVSFLGLALFGRVASLTALLTHPLLTHLGVISYGLYLYHLPVYYWTDQLVAAQDWHVPALLLAPAKLAVSYLLAVTSWRWIERPLLALKRHFQD